MKRRQLARIKTVDGKRSLDFKSRKAFIADLDDFKDEELVWVEVSSYRKQRTLPQNAFFHVICQIIADESGQDLETVKSMLKIRFCQYPVLDKDGEQMHNEATGEVITYIKDTRNHTTDEMGVVCDRAIEFAHDFFGIVIESNTQSELKFTNT